VDVTSKMVVAHFNDNRVLLQMFKHIKESLRKIPESEVQSLILRDEYTEQMRNALQKELEMLQDGMKQLEVDAFL